MRKNKVYSTLDAYQAGWLTLKGHTPQLVNQSEKVIFIFTLSESLIKDLSDYNAGALVEASRFAFAVKTLKSQIHSMRRNKEEINGKKKSQT